MRQIRFRVRDVTEQWTYFELNPATMLKGVPKKLKDILRQEEGYEIMQWTGLKDKKGGCVFEGDIIKYKLSGSGMLHGELIGPVLFQNGAFVSDKYSSACIGDFSEIEVIGNIYEPIT